MTKDKQAKRAARERAAAEGVSYTAARAVERAQRAAAGGEVLALRDWSCSARVRITREQSVSNVFGEVRTFDPGEVLVMHQWGIVGREVERDAWWTTHSVDGAHIVPAAAVEVLEVLTQVDPLVEPCGATRHRGGLVWCQRDAGHAGWHGPDRARWERDAREIVLRCLGCGNEQDRWVCPGCAHAVVDGTEPGRWVLVAGHDGIEVCPVPARAVPAPEQGPWWLATGVHAVGVCWHLPDPPVVPDQIASDRDYYTRMVAPVGAALTQVCRRMVAGVDLTTIVEPAEQVAAYLNPDPDLDRPDAQRACGHHVDDRCPGCAVCTVCADCMCH